jgi:hypothetical protein
MLFVGLVLVRVNRCTPPGRLLVGKGAVFIIINIIISAARIRTWLGPGATVGVRGCGGEASSSTRNISAACGGRRAGIW